MNIEKKKEIADAIETIKAEIVSKKLKKYI